MQPEKNDNVDNKKELIKIYEEFFSSIKDFNEYLDDNLSLEKIKNQILNDQFVKSEKKGDDEIRCLNCNNNTFEENICVKCGEFLNDIINLSTSYNDSKRISITNKYRYNRITHFKECLLQFQGKENIQISKDVYNKIIDALERNHLLVGDNKTPKKLDLKNFKRTHLYILKQLNLSKFYDNINYIYHKITDNPLPNLKNIEHKIINDFIKFTTIYDEKIKNSISVERKKNTQYILYQLLKKHKFNCSSKDFGIPKTLKRLSLYDKITKYCFTKLKWNVYPIE